MYSTPNITFNTKAELPSSPMPPTHSQLFTRLETTGASINELFTALEEIRDSFLPLLSASRATPAQISQSESSLRKITIQCGDARYRLVCIKTDLEKLIEARSVSVVLWGPDVYWDGKLQGMAAGLEQRMDFLRVCVEEIKVMWAVKGRWK